MNVKKYLKQQAKQDREAILKADDGETLRALGVEYPAPKKRKRLKGWIWGAIGAAMASVVLIVCLVVFYPTEKAVKYIDANDIDSRSSTLEELNGEIHDFSLKIDDSIYAINITRTFDRRNNDVLYYTIFVDRYDSIVKMEIVVVCNPDYEYPLPTFPDTSVWETLPAYRVYCDKQVHSDPQFGIDSLSCMAKIEGAQDVVYVTKYEELILGPADTFFETIQQIVQPLGAE